MSKVDPMTQVCIHEAGHAVMMKMCGMQIKHVSVNRKNVESRRGAQGICVPVVKEISMINFAKVAVAGAVAESIAFGGCPVRRLNKLTDADDVEQMMVDADVGVAHRAKEKRRIVAMVTKSLKKHMDQVLAIAQEVDNNGKISGKVVDEIMKR